MDVSHLKMQESCGSQAQMEPSDPSGLKLQRVPKQRRSITLWMKAEMVRRHEMGATPTAISRAFNVPRTTVVTILKDKRRIKEYVGVDTPPQATTIRAGLVAEVERLLTGWIKEKARLEKPLTGPLIQDKARDIYRSLLRDRGDCEAAPEPFTASKGWFLRFKARTNLFVDDREEEDVTNMLPNVQVVQKKPDDDASSGFEEPIGSKNLYFKEELPSPNSNELDCDDMNDIKSSLYNEMLYENRRYDADVSKMKKRKEEINKMKYQNHQCYIPHNKDSENEFEIFGKYVAVQLKQLPLDSAIEIQSEIQQLLCQKRLQYLHQ